MMRSSTMKLALPALCALPLFLACPVAPPVEGEGEGEGNEGEGEEGEGEPAGDGCPAGEGTSVCDIQDASSDDFAAEGSLVTLTNVIASSARFVLSRDDAGEPDRLGVFVTDAVVEARSGVLVTFRPTDTAPAAIAIGDVLTVVGTVAEIQLAAGVGAPNKETRVEAQTITATGAGAAPTPVVLSDASVLASESAGEDFEGVLVTINDVEVTAVGDFGQFTVSGGIVTDDTLFKYDTLVGETFTSLTGVVSYNIFTGGGFRLLPRRAADIDSSFRPQPDLVTVSALNDGTVPRCPGDGNFFQCLADIGGVVTGPAFFISENAQRGPLFGFYIADPAAIDGDGRQTADSGILVTLSPEDTISPVALDGYTFDQDDNNNFTPGAAPEIGDIVEIKGDNAERFGERAVRFTSRLKKAGTATTAPKGALFTTANAAELKGGRPDVTGNFPGFDPPIEAVAAAANIARWHGVLVELQGVTTTTACYNQVNGSTGQPGDFGNFLVTGDVEIGDAFRLDQGFGGFFNGVDDAAQRVCSNVAAKCQDSREAGQVFAKLVGVVGLSFDVTRVSPRVAADIDVDSGFVAPGTPDANCP